MLFYKGGIFKGLPLNQGFVLAYNAAFIAFPLLLGVAVRSRRERERELAARTSELQREREENARRAVFDERVRIARELHDVVAHHVSVMGVQAGAARRVMARQPEKAEEVLSSIEASSRQAVVELHRLLGFLRRRRPARRARAAARPRPAARARRPGRARRAERRAVGRGRAAAAAAHARGVRLPRDPGGADERPQAFRRRRPRRSASTTSRRRSRSRCSTTATAGRAARANQVGGHGLIGMRERVGLHGGHLRAGHDRTAGSPCTRRSR